MLAETWIPDLSALFSHFLAESILVVAIPVIVLGDLLARPDARDRRSQALGLVALVAAFLAALFQPTGQDLTTLLRADGLAKAFRLLALGTGIVAAVSAVRSRDLPRAHTEFFVLLLGAVLGACLTAAANDLAMLYLAIETLSICGYLLAGFKKADPKGSEAAMKYVLFGAISSGLMLYGMTLLYGFAGTATITSATGPSVAGEAARAMGEPLFVIAILLVFAGLAYKVAAAPFQFWCPDVYEGSPTSVAAFLAVASKGAGFAATLRVIAAASGGGAAINEYVQGFLLVAAVVTMTVGNVAALRQENSKRLLAYSAIAHAGYLLLGVAVTSRMGTSAVIFYMVVYLFMTLGAFYMVAHVEKETGRVDVDAFSGLGFRAPVLGVCMAVCLISLTGLPPTAGFLGKFFLFKEVFDYAGREGSALFFWGGIIGLLNSVVALAYYAKFLKVMYLCEEDRKVGAFAFPRLDKSVVLALTVPVLVLGILFQTLGLVARDLAGGLF